MMRKRIAFLAGAISFDNQSRVVDGVLKRASEMGIDVYIFTCFVNYDELEENKIGAFRIMDLPDFSTFDGVICMKNSIKYEPAARSVVNRIIKSKVPAVSIDEKINGMHYVGISDYKSQKSIVEHLINEHHLTKINYVCGILEGKEGADRYRAYRDAMAEHGIPVCDDQIYYGNYNRESGRKAVEFFAKTNMPQAIVFANDAMAIGGTERLRQYGYRVPEDIVITGFDNDELSEFCVPSLTTVDRRQQKIGETAVDLLLANEDECEIEQETQVLYRESCGCNEQSEMKLTDLRIDYQNKCLIYEEALDTLKSMQLDLTGLESIDELCGRLKKYVIKSDMKSFYLCLCDRKKLFEGDTLKCESYTQNINIPIAYHNEEFSSYNEFPTRDILPEAVRNTDRQTFYVVTPIYYQKICYGYCISDGSTFALKSELSYLWTVNIAMALENIRKWKWINRMNEKISRMWKYDMLTQVLNRSGFFFCAEELVKDIKSTDSMAFMIFLDIDGLKSVNDNQGHEVGDAFIAEIADVLKRAVPKDCLIMRYGGDEFVVFGSCENGDRMRAIVSRIKAMIAEANEAPDRRYTLSASFGCSVHDAAEIENLNGLIEAADKQMYQEKKAKKKYPSVAYELAEKIQEKTDKEVRITVPGHTQRGGSPCAYDRVFATRVGAKAAELILNEEYGYMVAMRNGETVKVPLEEVAGKLKYVDPQCGLIQEARTIGISFGDK